MKRINSYSDSLKSVFDEVEVLKHLSIDEVKEQLDFIILLLQYFQKEIQSSCKSHFDSELHNRIGLCISYALTCKTTEYNTSYKTYFDKLTELLEGCFSSIVTIQNFLKEY